MARVLGGECGVAVAAEAVERRLARMGQIGASAPMAFDAGGRAGLVEIIVMASDAAHAGMAVMRKVDADRCRADRRFKQHVRGERYRQQQQAGRGADVGGATPTLLYASIPARTERKPAQRQCEQQQYGSGLQPSGTQLTTSADMNP